MTKLIVIALMLGAVACGSTRTPPPAQCTQVLELGQSC